MIDELRRFARGETYDEQVMPEFGSEVLDFRAASESFAPVRKLKRPDLETLRLVDKYQRRKVLTIGGMLLFGKERERCFPDAWIQAGRFRGTDKTPYGANIRTSCMILLSSNITDNLFGNDKRHTAVQLT